MISQSRLALMIGCMGLTLSTLGCSDAFNAGPLEYVESDALTKEIPGKANLAGKPVLQKKSAKPWSTSTEKTPKGSRSPKGRPARRGDLLGELSPCRRRGKTPGPSRFIAPSTTARPIFRVLKWAVTRSTAATASIVTEFRGRRRTDGPVLYPSPRDYRKGIFKFTSTPTLASSPPR